MYRIFFVLVSLSWWVIMPQSYLKEMATLFKNGNYPGVIQKGEQFLRMAKDNPEFNYLMGMAYLKTRIDRRKAIPYLLKAYQLKYPDRDILFYIGRAYHYNIILDSAEYYYNEYKKEGGGKFIKTVDTLMHQIEVLRKYMKNPLNVLIQNIGNQINSPYPDYLPFVPVDESYIVFTSRRNTNLGGVVEFDGYYNSDIWYAEMKNGIPQKAKNLSNLNTNYDEQVCGISPDGSRIFIYIDHIKEKGDIYESKRIGNNFSPPVKFDVPINTPEMEYSACSSADGTLLFIVSDRAGGYGGKDIYLVRKLPTGEWSLPENLPPQINTPFDEEFPYLFIDNTTLYFSSQGHENFGGFDLFESKWNPEKNEWTEARNLGYPINTPDDDISISWNEARNVAYIASARPHSSFGDLDIYRVIFMEDVKSLALFVIRVVDNTGKIVKDAEVKVVDASGGILGKYRMSPTRNTFIIPLPVGEYSLLVEIPNANPYMESIKVDYSSVKAGIIEKEIIIH